MSDMTSVIRTITPEQAAKIGDLLVARLTKAGLPADATQEVLETQGQQLANELLGIVRQRVEALSGRIPGLAENIDRTITNEEAVKATGRNISGDISQANNLPAGTGDTEKLRFLPLKKRMSPVEVDAFVKDAGCKYASLHGVAKYNKLNPYFADTIPHFIQGTDSQGRHSSAAFENFLDVRCVFVRRDEGVWNDFWFAAVVLAS